MKNIQYNTNTHVHLKGRTANITHTHVQLKGRTANIKPIHV